MKKCKHRRIEMLYTERIEWMRKQIAQGNRQLQCCKCHLWLFPCER